MQTTLHCYLRLFAVGGTWYSLNCEHIVLDLNVCIMILLEKDYSLQMYGCFL